MSWVAEIFQTSCLVCERICQVSSWGAWGLALLIVGRVVNRSRAVAADGKLERMIQFFHLPSWVWWECWLDMGGMDPSWNW